MFYAVDVQHIDNPGYNRDRGPVWVGRCAHTWIFEETVIGSQLSVISQNQLLT